MQRLPSSVLVRCYGHMDMPKLAAEDVKRRVMTVCRNFAKINEDEVRWVFVNLLNISKIQDFKNVKC